MGAARLLPRGAPETGRRYRAGMPLRRVAVLLVALALALALASCGGGPAPAPGSGSAAPSATPFTGEPRKVIVDTDMAADDWLAILFLLGRPEVEIVAITITGTGEAHCEPGIRNALAIVALGGRPNIPVACGRETPLQGTNAFPAPWRENVDRLAGVEIPDGTGALLDGTAVELLETAMIDAGEPVTLLALGPLTNVGELLRDRPELAQRIEATVIMGGAVEVDGNVGRSGVGIDNPSAEWNIFCDPLAAKLVLDAGPRVTLVPLDATNRVPVTTAFLDGLAASARTPGARFVADVLESFRPSIEGPGYFFWDPLAAAILVDESLAMFDATPLTVTTQPGPEEGRTIRADAGPAARFATSADAARFEATFLAALDALPG